MKPTKEYNGRSRIRMYHCDCMELMKTGTWDLAIVDPPYGLDDKLYRSSYGKNSGGSLSLYAKNRWDKKPTEKYFNSLIRASVNQIVWGGNYFTDLLKPNRCWLCWNKDNPATNFSSIELAWGSFDLLPNYFYYAWGGLSDGVKGRNKKNKSIHPTQKPVQLYKWLLTNYAKEGDTILDTHGGSMSIAIACWDLGFDLDICELDTDYFNDAVKRFESHISQAQLF